MNNKDLMLISNLLTDDKIDVQIKNALQNLLDQYYIQKNKLEKLKKANHETGSRLANMFTDSTSYIIPEIFNELNKHLEIIYGIEKDN